VANRWIRFLLAVVAIAAASAATYRVLQNEQRLARDMPATRRAALAADSALSSAEELKAALHAYVAPGQDTDFWTTRARLLLDKLRSTLLELDAVANPIRTPMAESLDLCDRLTAAEQRAQRHVRDEQRLLAGEIIFTEARDLLDALRIQIARSRDQISTTANERESEIRREQMYLLGGGAGVLALVMLLLVPTSQRTQVEVAPEPPEAAVVEEPPAPAPVSPAVHRGADVSALASVCADLAAITESSQLEPLLDRVRRLLDARGVIVWMTTADRSELNAVAASGYEKRMIVRLGTIPREANNLTADAFRENSGRRSSATETTAAAIAVPLPAAGGPAGVLSAELSGGTDVSDSKFDCARVVAAQLGAVLGTAIPKLPGEADAGSSAAAARSSS
jgi:hypothetical protein